MIVCCPLPRIFALCAVLVGCTSGLASATPSARDQPPLDSTVRFLQDVQNMDGGFGGEPGAVSDPDFSAWVALALAADGINPQNQARPGGTSAYTYLVGHADALTEPNGECSHSSCTTELERVLLVVDASGTSPHDFGGVDLVEEILGRQLSDGSFTHEVGAKTAGMNDTIFAILALSLVSEPAAQAAVQRAATWLEGEQNTDGSWPAICPKTAVTTCAENGPERGEVDMTGAAVQALNAAGRYETLAQRKAFEYLHGAQAPNGGFSEFPGEAEPNVASSAWAVQAIWSAGQNPESWLEGAGNEPLSYMESMQQENGSIRYRAHETMNDVWMTAYVAPAFAGRPLPIPPVPLALPTAPAPPNQGSTDPSSPSTAAPGQGGESSQPGSGVIAGGGGDGAALFSRPKPQSKGETPGGVRLLSSRHQKNESKHRREPNLHHNTVTATTLNTPRPEPGRDRPEPGGEHHGDRSGPASRGLGAAATGAGSSTSTGSVLSTRGPGSASAGTGPGGSAAEHPLSLADNDSQQGGGEEVKGVLIDSSTSTDGQGALEPGAPGFHSAGAGGNQTPWLALAIAGALLLSFLVGAQLEHRRPQAIL
jgi:prenyltransferase beta subunit